MVQIVQLKTKDYSKSFDKLEQIVSPIKGEINLVDEIIKQSTQSSIPLIPELANHLLFNGGKRIRPSLTIFSTKLFDHQENRHLKLAACIELIHSATLLHDDVVDEGFLRRGKKTANAVWGNKASILVGDDSFSWTGFSFWYAYHYEAVGGGCPVYGCTDPEADNYNPDATLNQVYWGCTDSNADNYDPNANVEDGSCDCGDSATAYIVNMTDSFGDSWNGNNLILSQDGVDVGSFTIEGSYPNASEGQASVCLADGCYEVTCDGGSWQGEVWWEIVDSEGNVLLTGGAPFSGLIAVGDESACGDLIGCTDIVAMNYNENAIQDDGSCEYGCLDENGEISEIFEYSLANTKDYLLRRIIRILYNERSSWSKLGTN